MIGSTVSHYLDVMNFLLYVSFGDPASAALITCANIDMLAIVTWAIAGRIMLRHRFVELATT